MRRQPLMQGRLCFLAVFLSLALLAYILLPGLRRRLGHQGTGSTKPVTNGTLLTLDLGPGAGRVTLFVREAAPSNAKGEVLLLHGAAFTSQTWQELGTMHVLANNSFRAVALDLPGGQGGRAEGGLECECGGDMAERSQACGYGNSPRMPAVNTDELKASLLLEVFKALRMEHPILISPSMSGRFSLPYLMSRGQRLRAFIPIAPVHTAKYKSNEYEKIQTPTFIVYGGLDTNLGVQSLQRLILLPNHRVLELPQAGHSAYKDQPHLFHQGLLDFLLSLPK
ncbi:putative protein-lysine deacylase ABHD14B isoform X1 [Petromyzon marinus]|uniref:putative protein-lysine deacylase ABHD14B isoform X1 n=1 Tax=Petromyzon marinus TaxID=7757 RepID=UPI003F6E9B69